jgi:nicotinate phosphoribosyltransferase
MPPPTRESQIAKAILPEHSGLFTDLYELTMAAGYVQTGFEARATFELFARELPSKRNYLVAAGLEQCLDFLESVRFSPEDIKYLRRHPVFRHIRQPFFDYLANFRFTGDVWAIPEGSLVFPGEPLLRVTAPIAEAQIVETFLLSAVSFQTLVASKAARIVTAARGRAVIEFGARRNHSSQAGVLAARAAFVGGCQGTSIAGAGRRFGIPTYGTQAHSWVMAYEDEDESFRHFLDAFPDHAYLLLDTYDVRAAMKKILAMGRKPAGVRLDSGDIEKDSRWTRQQLDRVGWSDVRIFVSGDLDEAKIADLLKRGAPIDSFGVGAALSTPHDAPQLSLIYKLVELERNGLILEAAKLSHAKATYPGCKQVHRFRRHSGEWSRDVIALDSESSPGGEPLLVPAIRAGKRVLTHAGLAEARERCLASMALLPHSYRRLNRTAAYPVRHSAKLEALLEQVRRRNTPHKPPA